MSLSDQDEGVKKRAVDNIMKLINSQLALEKKQAKMDAKVRDCVVVIAYASCMAGPTMVLTGCARSRIRRKAMRLNEWLRSMKRSKS